MSVLIKDFYAFIFNHADTFRNRVLPACKLNTNAQMCHSVEVAKTSEVRFVIARQGKAEFDGVNPIGMTDW